MKVRIVANFHVFVPKDGRDRRVAFVAGTVIDAGDMPAGHAAGDWVERGLAEEVGGEPVPEDADDLI